MGTGLREVLELPERPGPTDAQSNGRSNELRQRFRESLQGVNDGLARSATLGGATARGELAQQRERLCGAYQQVLQQVDAGTSDNAERLLTASNLLADRAAAFAQNGTAEQEQWAAVEPDFDLAIDRVVELEDASHPKAAVLRKLCDAIRTRVNDREYRQAATAFGQMKPKLDEIYGEYRQSNGSVGTADLLRTMHEHNARLQQQNEERLARAEAEAQQLRDQSQEVEVRQHESGGTFVIGTRARTPEDVAPEPPATGDLQETAASQPTEQPSEAALLRTMQEHNARLQQQNDERQARVLAEAQQLRDQGQEVEVRQHESGGTFVIGTRARTPEDVAPEPPTENKNIPTASESEVNEIVHPPSSLGDSTYEALNGEARELYSRASRLLEELRIDKIARAEFEDYRDRLNSYYGRLRDPENASNAQELRRVVTDLRELISDYESRLREVRTHPETSRANPAVPETPMGQSPSDRPDATFGELEQQAQALFRRARDLQLELRPVLPRAEGDDLTARLNTFNGRINDPALRGNPQEMRRVISDLYATIQDFERRSRSVVRDDVNQLVGDLAAGRLDLQAPEAPRAGSGVDLGTLPSVRPDATFEELRQEARDLHARVRSHYEQLQNRVGDNERISLLDRINTVHGQIQALGNQQDAQEYRRLITDLRAMIDDLEARRRELDRNPAEAQDPRHQGMREEVRRQESANSTASETDMPPDASSAQPPAVGESSQPDANLDSPSGQANTTHAPRRQERRNSRETTSAVPVTSEVQGVNDNGESEWRIIEVDLQRARVHIAKIQARQGASNPDLQGRVAEIERLRDQGDFVGATSALHALSNELELNWSSVFGMATWDVGPLAAQTYNPTEELPPGAEILEVREVEGANRQLDDIVLGGIGRMIGGISAAGSITDAARAMRDGVREVVRGVIESWNADGFAVEVARTDVQGRPTIVVAYRGTEGLNLTDWRENEASGGVVSPQYRQAAAYLEQVVADYPGEPIMTTGHSLGGGLAWYAAEQYYRRHGVRIPSTGFNPAGPAGPQNEVFADGSPSSGTHVTVSSQGDMLSQGFGRDIAGVPSSDNPCIFNDDRSGSHGMEDLLEALQLGDPNNLVCEPGDPDELRTRRQATTRERINSAELGERFAESYEGDNELEAAAYGVGGELAEGAIEVLYEAVEGASATYQAAEEGIDRSRDAMGRVEQHATSARNNAAAAVDRASNRLSEQAATARDASQQAARDVTDALSGAASEAADGLSEGARRASRGDLAGGATRAVERGRSAARRAVAGLADGANRAAEIAEDLNREVAGASADMAQGLRRAADDASAAARELRRGVEQATADANRTIDQAGRTLQATGAEVREAIEEVGREVGEAASIAANAAAEAATETVAEAADTVRDAVESSLERASRAWRTLTE